MENFTLKYFLAANSCEGFISSFSKCYDASDGWRAYIIKGGPGTGKSSFMKYITAKAMEKGIVAELFPCSSDPDSLDAVIFPEKRLVIMDGTAPHTVDPSYPGICEQIINLGSFWDKEKLKSSAPIIKKLTDKNKLLHKAASRYLQAAGSLITDNLKIADACTEKEKVLTYAKNLCRRYIPITEGTGKEWERYLCGVTPRGIVSYGRTALYQNKCVIIKDDSGSVSGIVMKTVRDYALMAGYEIITVKNSFLPSKLCDGVIIPKLSLSFIREYDFQHLTTDIRRVHSRRFIKAKNLNKSRERLKFNKKATNELLLSAVSVLREAKLVHDDLEKHYINAMDFNSLSAFAEKFTQELF